MFSSTSSNGISPFSQVSPFLNWSPSTSSSFSLNEAQAFLNYHYEDLLSCCFTVSPIIDTATKHATVSTKKTTATTNGDTNPPPQIPGGSDQCFLPINLHEQCWPKKKTAVKRDRHSKIFTAQGPRDRRVRLSIDISKKFFGLQDLLGFDKASLTLDWLLTKSKTAIRELLQTKQIDNANAMFLCSLSEDGDFVAAAATTGDDSKKTATSKRKRKTPKQKGSRKPKMSSLDKLAKESRAKARERARERTREKNFLRNLCQEQKLPDLISFNPPITSSHQSRWNCSQIGTCKPTDSSRQSTLSSSNENTQVEGFFFVNPRAAGVDTEEMLFQESVRNRRKTSKPGISSSFGFHRNLIVASKQATSDFNNWTSGML